MSNCLLSIGSFPERALSTVSSAFACGAVNPVPRLDIFQLCLRGSKDSPASYVEDLSSCCNLLSHAGIGMPVFNTVFSFRSCTVVLPSAKEFAADPDAEALLSALRGRNLPLSFRTDREAVEWAFSFLLTNRPNDSVDSFLAFVARLRAELSGGSAVRLAILCDLSDSFSSGAAFALLPYLRTELPGALTVSLIAMAEADAPVDEAFFPSLAHAVRDLRDRHFLRESESDPPRGADSAWFLSMPPSMLPAGGSHALAFFAAARALSVFFSPDQPMPSGLHICEVSGAVSLGALGDRAGNIAAFLECASWMLSDLLPSLRAWLAHPVRLTQLNSRNGLYKTLFSGADASLSASVAVLDRSLKSVLSECLSFLKSVPAALRFSEEADTLWRKAKDACGRFITVASEVDVTRAEIMGSGLQDVKPVHRDSLEDTDEERLRRQLDDMDAQLIAEARQRDEALAAVGPFRSLQARRDCALRCRSALETAQARAALPVPDSDDHLTLARRERRLRLLEAAVRLCDSDLSSAAASAGASSLSPGSAVPVILTPRAFSAIEGILAAGADESALKELRDCLPVLLLESSLPDVKELSKALLSLPRPSVSPYPLAELFRRAWHVCLSAVSTVSFSPWEEWPSVPLLPDLLPAGPVNSLSSLLSLLPSSESGSGTNESEKRGLLAMLILSQYKRRQSGDPEFSVRTLHGTTPLLRCWLSAFPVAILPKPEIHILSMAVGNAGDRSERPFALVIPGLLFQPAKRVAQHASLIPSFATWYRADSASFADPVPFLSEGDRSLLSARLVDILAVLPADDSPLRSFLSSFLAALSGKPEQESSDPGLSVRLSAVCGLLPLPAYRGILSRVQRPWEHSLLADPAASCLTGIKDFPASPCAGLPDDILYAWHGIPFARENSARILESAGMPSEEYALKALESECHTLSGISDDYRDEFLRSGEELLSRFSSASDDSRELLASLMKKAEKPLRDLSPEFTWPWDPLSPSVRTVLSECLGSDTLSVAASCPFSDLLCVFPARGRDAVGDAYFGGMCSLLPFGAADAAPPADAPVIAPDAVLPPLSPSLASALTSVPEARVLLTPDFLALSHPDEHSFRVVITLNGAFPLRLSRIYAEEDLVFLYAHDLPTLALWPSVPFRPEQWRAYYVYAHLPESFSVSVLLSGSADPVPLEGTDARHTALFRYFPSVFLFYREDRTAGALPNILPEPQIKSSGEVTACIDFGSVGTSVILSSGNNRQPLHGPTMVRLLLNNPAASPELLRREFMPAVPVSALLPTASRIFRNVPGATPVPFVDGIILMSMNLQDVLSIPSDALYTCLKWEEEKGRSNLLCLHQVMLMAALQARVDGASRLAWRFAVPDEMAREGRESLRMLFRNLADQVMEESGFQRPEDVFPVSLASESAALGAYFRLCAWEDTRGGFMVLDLGASTADISLFLRGRTQAVRTCQIPLGVHYMLLPALLKDPTMLERDFGTFPDTAFRSDLNALTRILEAARTDPPALRKARMALDHFLTDHYPLLLNAVSQLASAGLSSRFGAVLLLHLSFLTMLSGLILLQIAADPNKNDFLPEQMSLCLSGRGALLIESLPDQVKKALWRFLTMFRNKRVAALSLLFSAEKKMEIPVGLSVLQEVSEQLPPSSAAPASISVRPEALLPEFLLRFAREFSGEANLLFPGFFTGDYYHPFSQAGEAAVTASIDQSFTASEMPRPYDSLAAWIGNLLDLV